ncbi:MAG: response regulator transcription factor [Coriobacteriales bacterium]|jgi:DNA-binding response OmpR family regulator|nr:response regulator transcription factor [Coriobacteriales bacterium]
MEQNILLVEDQINLSAALVAILTQKGYRVDAVYDGVTGLEYAQAGTYDAIVLDVMLPKMDGFAVISELRRSGNDVPTIMLTARDTLRDKITGLDAGADDYLTKPFQPAELLARLRALTRRQGTVVSGALTLGNTTLDLESGDLCILANSEVDNKKNSDNISAEAIAGSEISADAIAGSVANTNADTAEVKTTATDAGTGEEASTKGFSTLTKNANATTNAIADTEANAEAKIVAKVHLSQREFDVCQILMANPGQTISKSRLLERIWGMDSDADENSVEAYVSFVRKKLSYLGSNLNITTLRMLGYRIEVKNE